MTEPNLPTSPITLFSEFLDEAKEKSLSDPTAMVLSTCGPGGKPSSRVVLLKGFSEEGFTFFTNYFSRKSRELTDNPYAALNFYWPEIGRQIRIEGTVAKISPTASDSYFSSRPRLSQLGAWASDQSHILKSRQTLLDRLADLETKYKDQEVPRPPYWGGIILRPTAMEFWINGEFRLHDRFLYTKANDHSTWFIDRLNP